MTEEDGTLPAYYNKETNQITLNVPPPETFEDEAEELIFDVRVRRRNNKTLAAAAKSKRGKLFLVAGVTVLLAVVSGFIGFSWSKKSQDSLEIQESKNDASTNTDTQQEPGPGPIPESTLPPQEAAAIPDPAPEAISEFTPSPEEVAALPDPETVPITPASTTSAPTGATMVSTPSPTAISTLNREARIAQQIESFKRGTGLLLNLNIVHHGGSTICLEMSHLRTPSFVCMQPRPEDQVADDYPGYSPWSHNETARNIELVKRNFDFLIWDARDVRENPSFSDTNWEDPNLVSILVVREPISRSLSGDADMNRKYPSIWVTKDADEQTWMEFANEDVVNNNYALRILAGDRSCCDGNNTDRRYLEEAKEMVQRFTFVLDFNCLEHSLTKMSEMLGIDIFHYGKADDSLFDHRPIKDQIPYPAVYDFLAEKNKLDIELYEWSKQYALLNCHDLYGSTAAPTASPTWGRDARVAQQIENFKNGHGILLNLNIVHHGGSTICEEMANLRTPSFVCLRPKPEDPVSDGFPDYSPWSYNETARNIELVKRDFDFLVWDARNIPMNPSFRDTNWEDPNLVSILVVREPIARSLSGDADMNRKYPSIWVTKDADEQTWMEFANEEIINNNFALRILAGDQSCCDGNSTDRRYLEQAKEMVQRFTFVLDFNCLEHSLTKMSEVLGFDLVHYRDDSFYDHGPIEDQIPYPAVYEFLAEKNKLDIELYEWAKQFALVNCDQVYAAEAAAAGGDQPTGGAP